MAIMKSFWNHCKLYLPQNKPNGLSETWLSDMSIIVRVHHDMNGKDGVTSQHMSSIQYKKVASSHKNKQLAHVEWTKTSPKDEVLTHNWKPGGLASIDVK